MNEFEILEKLKPLTSNHPSSLCLTDDACVLDKLSTKQFVVTTDSIVENVHFFSGDDPGSIAHKLLAVNLSDIAAMGGTPKYYLTAMVLRKDTDQKWIDEFCEVLSEQNKRYDILVVGGDTVRHKGPLVLTMTMIGEVDKYHAVTRSGAQESDSVYVTGSIGDAALGLLIRGGHKFNELTKAERKFLLERYERPVARVEVGKQLVKIASSMIDISDGFIQDASHIGRNSGVQLDINLRDIPLSSGAQSLKANPSIAEIILSGGDDYELLFTCSDKFEGSVKTIAAETGISITKIGKVTKGSGVIIRDATGKEMKFSKAGYVH